MSIINSCQDFESESNRYQQELEVCRYLLVDGFSNQEVSEKTGLSSSTIYRILHKFEVDNPRIVEEMRKKGKDLVPEDYEKLRSELCRLQGELKREKLRADFYEEMVAYGKEVYGIDLKKVGTK